MSAHKYEMSCGHVQTFAKRQPIGRRFPCFKCENPFAKIKRKAK